MIVGGFLVAKSDLSLLDDAVVRVKSSFGLDETDPIKWDMSKCPESQRKLGPGRTPQLRHAMAAIPNAVPIEIIMSHVWMGAPSNKVSAWKWSFENILQRLCIILDRKVAELEHLSNYPFMDIVFDWLPARGPLKGYFDVYRDAYVRGFRFARNSLPALRQFKVCPCLLATSSCHSLALQLTDFLLGATGEFFSWVYEEGEESNVRAYFSPFFSTFHRDETGEMVGPGLVVKAPSREKVRSKLRQLQLL